jgi:hypothetical protein
MSSWFKYALASVRHACNIDQLKQLLPYNINCELLNDMRSLPNLIFSRVIKHSRKMHQKTGAF